MAMLSSGCSNTTDLRFENVRAVFYPVWINKFRKDEKCTNLLIGTADNIYTQYQNIKIYLKNGDVLVLSDENFDDLFKKNFSNYEVHDVSKKRGPAINPGKSYFVWKDNTKSMFSYPYIDVFKRNGKIISVHINTTKDVFDVLEVKSRKRNFPLRQNDLKYLFGEPEMVLRYLSE